MDETYQVGRVRMKKLVVILFAAAMLLAPLAASSDARGGRGGRGRGATIGGRTASRTAKGGAKEKQRMRELIRSEERDSLIDGKLRRRSR